MTAIITNKVVIRIWLRSFGSTFKKLKPGAPIRTEQTNATNSSWDLTKNTNTEFHASAKNKTRSVTTIEMPRLNNNSH